MGGGVEGGAEFAGESFGARSRSFGDGDSKVGGQAGGVLGSVLVSVGLGSVVGVMMGLL